MYMKRERGNSNIYTVPYVSVGACCECVCLCVCNTNFNHVFSYVGSPTLASFCLITMKEKDISTNHCSPSKILLRAYLVYYLCVKYIIMISTCEPDLVRPLSASIWRLTSGGAGFLTGP